MLYIQYLYYLKNLELALAKCDPRCKLSFSKDTKILNYKQQ